VPTIESSGTTTLQQDASNHFIVVASSLPVTLRYGGTEVVAGQFGLWTPIGAEQMPNGEYKIVWKNGPNDQYVVWNVDINGNFAGQSAVLTGASPELRSLEPGFDQNLNGDGGEEPVTVIEAFGSTTLSTAAGAYILSPSGSLLGPQLRMNGVLVTAGMFGNWTPIGAELAGNGVYQVAWKNGGLDQYIGWNVDSSGNFISQGAAVSGSSWYEQSFETALGQDLNNDGTIGPVTSLIEFFGSTSLTKVADSYFFNYGLVGSTQLKMNGVYVAAGQFGNWTPLGVERAANGVYQLAWKNGGLDQYIGWNVDGSGNFISQGAVVSGSSWYVQSFETVLGQNLNGDATLGPTTTPIESTGLVSLTRVADSFFFNYGSGPQLKVNGVYVATGQFGNWTPIGVEQGGNGYWLAWKNGPADQYVVWETDGAGNFLRSLTDAVSGSTATLQQFEPLLYQDLNGDGFVAIEAFGATKLVTNAINYFVDPIASVGGPALRYGGSPVTVGQLGNNWTPIGAEQTPTGYRVAWFGGSDQYIVWNTDAAGNYLSDSGVVSGGSAALRSLEPSLQQDLNRDGVIASVNTIESFGATSLLQVGNAFLFNNIYGPQLKMNGTVVDALQIGAWTPIGAEQVGGGYQVAFRLGSADTYTVWNTDGNGNYVSTALNPTSGGDPALQAFEPTFQQDLNRDSYLGHFDITVNYTGDSRYASYFTAAAQRWQQVIKADLPDVNSSRYGFIDDVLIDANVQFIDGVNGILGQAGPDELRSGSGGLPDHGIMTFDSADVAAMANNGTLFSVILHEMGHVLGIGSLWNSFGLRSGSSYLGTNANNAYHLLGGTGFVPLETTGGSGTAFVHWSEAAFDNELMTGFAEAPGVPMPLSIVTIGGMQDLGYKVDYSAADPYGLPGHLMADPQSSGLVADASQPASVFANSGASGFDAVSEPPVRANDEVSNASSAATVALMNNYVATTFVTAAAQGGGIAAASPSDQDFLAKPLA
jgi:hypothetical protein